MRPESHTRPNAAHSTAGRGGDERVSAAATEEDRTREGCF